MIVWDRVTRRDDLTVLRPQHLGFVVSPSRRRLSGMDPPFSVHATGIPGGTAAEDEPFVFVLFWENRVDDFGLMSVLLLAKDSLFSAMAIAPFWDRVTWIS